MVFDGYDSAPQPPSLLGGDNLSQNLGNIGKNLMDQVNSTLASAASVSTEPWHGFTSPFFYPITIAPERWNQLFPYRLLVIDASKGNVVVNGTQGTKITVKGGKFNNVVEFVPLGRKWIFTLPITPQQLNITDQFAINTTATLRGILEEHNGVKFKMIQASGTMGVWPYRESVVDPPTSPSVVQSLFGGTLEAFSNLKAQAQSVLNTATSGHPANKPVTKDPKSSLMGERSTGYYHALALQQFLEQYAEAKKDPDNAAWRLVFDIPKQNQSFVVTPVMFNWIQNEQKPTQIMYSMQLKAWRRVELNQSISPTLPGIQTVDAGILQRILNTISEARKLTSAAVDLIGAVRSDVERPLDVLRQTSLLVKDVAGAIITACDLPFQIQRDYKSAINDFCTSLSLNNLTGSQSTDPSVIQALQDLKTASVSKEGLSISAVDSGQLGTTAASNQTIDPAYNVFSQPERNFGLLDQVPVNSINLTPVQQAQVDTIVEDARQITVADLKVFRGVIQQLALQLSNNFGAGASFYSEIYGTPTPTTRITPMTIDEYELLKALYDVMQSYDILTASTAIDDANKQTNMEYVAGLADSASISFSIPTSKILAPVPFGLTIEQISARYLGNPQRWLEITTLNNLRDPYIDENGFQRPLLSNATGRQITISDTSDMFIGQRVLLQSSTQSPTARVILGIDRLSDTSFLLSLDGEPNLDPFVIADSAYLQAYLPGTVNSQQKIFIPSNLSVPNDPNILVPTSVAGDPLVGLSKVDWLLTDRGDIAINSFGDFRYSAGITNIVQALKLKIATRQGSVLVHPEYGLGVRAGIMNSDVNVQDIYNTLQAMIAEDPRFQSLDSLQISINGPVLSISMGVSLAGQQGVFPLTFELAA